ncbi:hypothetical protein NDU88_003949 [Pleurodeles waltl]|uniref:Uncharacterized protein n=1 Tax=Pleurodeles waltl TaxID=8319 RepID=A0AAV7SHD0_PLEWA|nr:hypothetical protein NDU88_003949 [Pleurodeles waltl]
MLVPGSYLPFTPLLLYRSCVAVTQPVESASDKLAALHMNPLAFPSRINPKNPRLSLFQTAVNGYVLYVDSNGASDIAQPPRGLVQHLHLGSVLGYINTEH